MNRKKILSALSAIALVAASGRGAFIIANADGTETPTEQYTIHGGQPSFASYIVMDSVASAPNEVISYSIQGIGDDTLQHATNYNQATVGDATFTNNLQTYTSQQTMQKANENQEDKKGTINSDEVDLTGGKKYVRTLVTADLSKVVFTTVGTYQFLITENVGSDPAVTYDTTPMVMEVYVVYDTTSTGANNSNYLKVDSYVMYKATKVVDGENVSYTINDKTKADGFVNQYNVTDLKIAKIVSGNQASHDEYFQFDVTLHNLQKGMKYVVDIDSTHADHLTTLNGLSTQVHTNYDSFESDDNGNATQTYWMHTGQYIIIKNVPIGSSYTVKEDAAKMTSEGYATTAVVEGDQINGNEASTTSGSAATTKLLRSGSYEHTETSTNTTNISGSDITTVSTLTYTYTFNTDGTGTVVYTGTQKINDETPTSIGPSSTSFSWQQTGANTVTIDFTSHTVECTLGTDGEGTPIITLPFNSVAAQEFKASATDAPLLEDGVLKNAVGSTISLDSNLKIADAYLKTSTTVTYTNEKHGTVPTGIIIKTAPYALVVLAGFFGLLIFANKKRKNEED